MAKREQLWYGIGIDKGDKNFTEPFLFFISILFVVIVGNGFRTFSINFDLERFFDEPCVSFFFLIYFLAGYFFVISDFIFYQLQIKRYPYRDGKYVRFFVDIVIFFLLFNLLDLSSEWPTPRRLWTFLLLLVSWHVFVAVWQLQVNYQYKRYYWRGLSHARQAIIYLAIFCLYNYSQRATKATWFSIPASVDPKCWLKLKDSLLHFKWWILCLAIIIVLSNLWRLIIFTNPDWDFIRKRLGIKMESKNEL